MTKIVYAPEERCARYRLAQQLLKHVYIGDGYSLDMRQKHAGCALDVRYTSADEHTTITQRVFRVCLALVQRARRVSGVLLACASMRRAQRTVLNMHKTCRRTQRITTHGCRLPSALDE